MLWEHDAISMWWFPRNRIPGDLSKGAGSANPGGWGAPYARFPLGGNCPSNHFSQHQMVFDLTFCGDWAGATFSQACPGRGSCIDFVRQNPGEFNEAYWSVNFVKILSQPNGGGNSNPVAQPVAHPVAQPVPQNNGNCRCRAKSGASSAGIQGALGWVCTGGNINCAPINDPNGAAYNPNTLNDHASWAFNSYYQIWKGQQGNGACDFSGNAEVFCGAPPPPPTCVCRPKGGVAQGTLDGALGWVCTKQDCSYIQNGALAGASFYDRATWAFTQYWHSWRASQGNGACDFGGATEVYCPPGATQRVAADPTSGSGLTQSQKIGIGISVGFLGLCLVVLVLVAIFYKKKVTEAF